MSIFNKKEMDDNFAIFKRKLGIVARFPRERFLYPIMRSVPYQDMETRLDMAMEEIGGEVQHIKKKIGEGDDE
jgi:hypothetical protein